MTPRKLRTRRKAGWKRGLSVAYDPRLCKFPSVGRSVVVSQYPVSGVQVRSVLFECYLSRFHAPSSLTMVYPAQAEPSVDAERAEHELCLDDEFYTLEFDADECSAHARLRVACTAPSSTVQLAVSTFFLLLPSLVSGTGRRSNARCKVIGLAYRFQLLTMIRHMFHTSSMRCSTSVIVTPTVLRCTKPLLHQAMGTIRSSLRASELTRH